MDQSYTSSTSHNFGDSGSPPQAANQLRNVSVDPIFAPGMALMAKLGISDKSLEEVNEMSLWDVMTVCLRQTIREEITRATTEADGYLEEDINLKASFTASILNDAGILLQEPASSNTVTAPLVPTVPTLPPESEETKQTEETGKLKPVRYQCNICYQFLATNQKKREHMAKQHYVELLFKCISCPKKFTVINEFKEHVKEHKINRAKTTKKRKDQQLLVISDSDEDPDTDEDRDCKETCRACGRSFASKECFEDHRKICF